MFKRSAKATYELKAAAFDEDRSEGILYATAVGFAHYVYVVHMDEAGKCDGIVKVWNDAYTAAVLMQG